ncbi:sigma-70 family RNA polymerase sigma factor [Candidatus Poribacteria bacterium]|nr:sigma-70 family RNA polymerase sigma factor [Candidatus Poribacteria bacterium]MBT5536436.1 sigma-70 family RNA polymerase sigma factor [Candidatus Poribacteria bacterium]MBT5710902.1 sigma-70 family RNA polymerase sigma factor [Candidatus Poribacteria bacterium]MBT7099877.1 sigma-70 family RNA polymerase sigma factor [Candidatus Poribacteria bacterium]MBT7805343.1 sigma-70 family RNA polymerase sigma factor [Candidatus Poribacteria bacterium]
MSEIRRLVERAGDSAATPRDRAEAFRVVVRRFEDMAYAYAYALLGNEADAQDAAQQAFLSAWRKISDLRDPSAFAGWLRSIVRTRCDALLRTARRSAGAEEAGAENHVTAGDPHANAEQAEVRDAVHRALAALPAHERVATTLYYIDGFSHAQIAGFLGVKETTVSTRLHSARGRLRGRLETMTREVLHQARPSRDDAFVGELFAAIKQSDVDRVRDLIDSGRERGDARDESGRGPMDVAATTDLHHGEEPRQVYSLLIEKGVRPDLGTAVKAGDLDLVAELVGHTPELLTTRFAVDFWDAHGGLAPVAIASRYGHADLMSFLIEAGGDPSADGDGALITARNTAAIDLLLDHGALIDPHPNAPCGPLAFQCELQNAHLVAHLLDRRADPNAPVWSEFRGGHPVPTNPDQGWESPALWLTASKRPIWPIHIALGTPFGGWRNLEGGYGFLPRIVQSLVDAGADVRSARAVLVEDGLVELTPLAYAHEVTRRVSLNTGTVAADTSSGGDRAAGSLRNRRLIPSAPQPVTHPTRGQREPPNGWPFRSSSRTAPEPSRWKISREPYSAMKNVSSASGCSSNVPRSVCSTNSASSRRWTRMASSPSPPGRYSPM